MPRHAVTPNGLPLTVHPNRTDSMSISRTAVSTGRQFLAKDFLKQPQAVLFVVAGDAGALAEQPPDTVAAIEDHVVRSFGFVIGEVESEPIPNEVSCLGIGNGLFFHVGIMPLNETPS